MVLIVAAAIVGGLPAQVPSQAVRIDPTIHLNYLVAGRSGDAVHVVGVDTNSPSELRYARSVDGGLTWPIRDRPLGSAGDLARIAVAGDRVFVAYRDGNGAQFVRASFDAGTTWQLPVSLPSGGWVPSIEAAGAEICVFCSYSFAVPGSVCLVRSVDGGQTWAPPVDLALGLPPGSAGKLEVVRCGAEIHVFWPHAISQVLHLKHQRSLDGGNSWLPQAQTIANAPFAGAGVGAGRVLVQAGSTLWASTNRGDNWFPLAGHGLGVPVDLAMDGGHVLAVEAVRIGANQVVRAAVSADAGDSWSVSSSVFTASQWQTVEAYVVDDAMFVRHAGSGTAGLYQSDDLGICWRAFGSSVGSACHAARDGCVVIGEDPLRTGQWIWVLEGHTRYGFGSHGSGLVVPTLEAHGLCGLGRTFDLELADAVGGTTALFVLTFAPRVSHAWGGAMVHVGGSPSFPFVVATSGAPAQVGAGSAALSVTIPNVPTFAGMRLLSQCFVLDPGTFAGFCATAARESWLN